MCVVCWSEYERSLAELVTEQQSNQNNVTKNSTGDRQLILLDVQLFLQKMRKNGLIEHVLSEREHFQFGQRADNLSKDA